MNLCERRNLTTVWITEEIKITLEQTAGTPFKSFPWDFKEDHATRLPIVVVEPEQPVGVG